MSLGTQKEPSIQMTLFDYFMDSDQFTLNEAVEAVKQVKEVKEPSVRGRIYEGISQGLFERIGRGVYTVKKTDKNGNENNCLLINGDGRDLTMFEDETFDALICDHPYKLDKSLKGGNRNFADYDSFQYTQNDLDEKSRVLKSGCFLIELLPEENGENYKYIYQVKEMAQKAGLNYYTTVPWKKGNFVANTGRKSKNTEQVVMFTKGKARKLSLDMKKINKDFNKPKVLHYSYTSDFKLVNSEETRNIDIKLIVHSSDEKEIKQELYNAWHNWMYEECKNSPLLSCDVTQDDLLQAPIEDYMFMWLDSKEYEYMNVSSPEFQKKDYFKSGTNGMLPTVFDVEPVKEPPKNPKNQIEGKYYKIHQSEKPVELFEQILNFVSKPKEKILDPYCGSGAVGEAALNTKRDSILIEKNENTYQKAVARVKRKSR